MNKSRTKVLHYVSIMDRGGEESFIMNVFRNIDREKLMFDFLCMLPEDGAYGPEIKEMGGHVWHADFDRRKDHLKTFDNAIVLRDFLKSHKGEFDAFHIHTQHAMDGVLSSWAAKKAGISKVVVHSHSVNTMFHRTAHKLCKPILRNMRIKRYACSDMAGKWLYGDGEYEIVKSGVESTKYLFNKDIRENVRKENGWEEKIVIGHVGNFTQPKNHGFMVEIMAELSKIEPNAIMVFVGQGERMKDFQRQASDLGLQDRIVFMGPRNDANELYQGMDYFLFPSIFEGLGMALIEAQISGLHCLASSTVPRDTCISKDCIRYKDLSEGPKSWAIRIKEDLDYERRDMSKEVKASDVDIRDVSRILSNYYLS